VNFAGLRSARIDCSRNLIGRRELRTIEEIEDFEIRTVNNKLSPAETRIE